MVRSLAELAPEDGSEVLPERFSLWFGRAWLGARLGARLARPERKLFTKPGSPGPRA